MRGSFKDLAADQRAVLTLVLAQGRGYEEIARLSGSDRAAVRARAHAAAERLAAADRPQDPTTRGLIIDYLLGVQTHSERVRSCYLLAGSPPAREWAIALARALAPLTPVPLPVIPGVRLPRSSRPPERPRPAPGSPRLAPSGTHLAIAAGLLVAAVVAVVLVLALTSLGSRTVATARGQTVDHLLLAPASAAGGRAEGAGAVLAQRGTMLLLLQAHGLSANRGNSYAVWLFNAPSDARLLGFISPPVGRSGKFSSGVALPDDAVRFHSVVITRETSHDPAVPGPMILRAPLSLS